MVPLKQFTRIAIAFCSLVAFWSCGLQHQVDNSGSLFFRSAILPQLVISQVLVETSEYIFMKDSKLHKEAIYIHNLTYTFISDSISRTLSMDSIKVIRNSENEYLFEKMYSTEDSVYYSKVHIPVDDIYLADSSKVSIVYQYVSDSQIATLANLKCLSVQYLVTNEHIATRTSPFRDCRVDK